MSSFRLISWNVRRRVGEGARSQLRSLAEYAPDVVALQEVARSAGAVYRGELERVGLGYVAVSLDLVGPRQGDPRRTAVGVLVASRWPLVVHLPSPVRVPWPERLLSATVKRDGGPFELHTVYVPNNHLGPKLGRPWLKVETFEGLYAGLARRATLPRILCGDFNAPLAERPDGTIVPSRSVRRAADAELSVLRGLATFDLADAFRALHGYSVQESSWYGSVRGYRLDHILATPSLNPVRCTYLHDLRRRGLSDHSPCAAVFAPGLPAAPSRRQLGRL